MDAAGMYCSLHTISGSGTVANLNSTSYALLTGECAASGNYTTGGVAVTGATVSGTSVVTFTTSAITFTNLTTTARYAVIRSSSSALIMYIDFGADQSPAGQNVVITPATTGLIVKSIV